MRIMNLKNANRQRVRGLKRGCRTMVKSINESTDTFPEVDLVRGYWHMHLPLKQEFIDSARTPHSVRRLCIQTLIHRTKHLLDMKPESDVRLRVVVCIELPNLWDSQIIGFCGESYFEQFFTRDDQYQKWTPLPSYRSIESELGLAIPNGFRVRGYREQLVDDEFKSVSELWFIGEV